MIFFLVGLMLSASMHHFDLSLDTQPLQKLTASSISSHSVHLMKDEPVTECTLGSWWTASRELRIHAFIYSTWCKIMSVWYKRWFCVCVCNMLYEISDVFVHLKGTCCHQFEWCEGSLLLLATAHESHDTHCPWSAAVWSHPLSRVSRYREKPPCRCSISPLRAYWTRATTPIMARNCMWVQCSKISV